MAEIRKAKVKNGKEEGLYHFEAEYSARISDNSSVQAVECKAARLHPDLIAAFANLNAHLARMTYQLDDKGLPISDDVVCKSFSLKGDDVLQGVVLSGIRKLPNGSTLTLNTSFTRFDDDDKYGHLEDLLVNVNLCEKEVQLYLFADKCGADPQGDLFADKDESKTKTYILNSQDNGSKDA